MKKKLEGGSDGKEGNDVIALRRLKQELNLLGTYKNMDIQINQVEKEIQQ